MTLVLWEALATGVMVDRIERLLIAYGVRLDEGGGPPWADLEYTPVAGGRPVDDLRGVLSLSPKQRSGLQQRTDGLFHALAARLGRQQLEIDGAVVDVRLKISHLWVAMDYGRMRVTFAEASRDLGHRLVAFSELTTAQKRLLDSVNATMDRLAWEHLRARLQVPGPRRQELQVFISYHAGHEKFAEALANRLGQEGIVPWFDKWEILAGDSIPGKIEEGLRDSMAFVPIITADYQEGRWATDELQNAITKRIEEDYRIIPVLLERCERPELIRHLRYVDFSSQDPETFEAKFAELIDGIYALELNPFR